MKTSWKSSYHGGHSGQFCDHAKGSLKEIVESAISKGFSVYGLSEHSPRYSEDQIFKEEKENGYDVDKLISTFRSYVKEAKSLKKEYAEQIELLVGFETEYISDDYLERMQDLRNSHGFDYIIGSVHHVKGICIDAYPDWTKRAIESCGGGIENFAVEYYQSIGRMVEALKPEIVGHIDLIKKCIDDHDSLNSSEVRKQMYMTLETIKKYDCALDLNVYPFRKGKSEPYPSSWIVKMASEMEIPFAFGDDSHSPGSVGQGLEQGREFLKSNGVNEVAIFKEENGNIIRTRASLS